MNQFVGKATEKAGNVSTGNPSDAYATSNELIALARRMLENADGVMKEERLNLLDKAIGYCIQARSAARAIKEVA